MNKVTVAVLEALFTANTDDLARGEKVVKATGDRIEKKPIKAKVDADTRGAVEGMKQVEDAARRVVTAKTIATVDANIERAEKQFMRLYERVDYLRSVSPELDVDADVARAVKQMERAQKQLEGLRGARAVMEVDANTQPLQDATDGVGKAAGAKVGADVEQSLTAALTAIPIAGGILLAGTAIGKALVGGIQAGMQVEVRQDRLEALTGVSEADARRLALAAGEAYASNFGESIESNMTTARLGLQFGILDPAATTRDAQKTIEGLAGIADVLEEDVKPTATAVATLLRTGLAKNADEAYDIIAAGARNGLNRNEDLLDTLTEYPVVLRKLGLSGAESLGLINQGLRAGARNTDVLADALKEFQIRATDGSDSSSSGFERLGLDAEEMTAKIARGGADARDGLDQVLRKLRETEDPVQRNAAAVELFGTKAEDLGDALFALDLSTAVDQLGQVNGAAQKMFDTLANNDASKLEQAKRNVETAVEGIQGALAAGFSEPLSDAALWVSQNRGPVLQFFKDMALGAIGFAETATEGVVEFVAGPLASMVDGLATVIDTLNGFDGRPKELDDLITQMRDMKSYTEDSSAAFQEMRDRVSEFIDPAIQVGHVADAAQRTASAVADLGSEHSTLHEQITNVVGAMQAELDAAAAAGESQDQLTQRYNTTTQALVDQMVQMGYTEEDARRLIGTYGAVPELVQTTFQANTSPAEQAAQSFLDRWNGRSITVGMFLDSSGGNVAAAASAARYTAQARAYLSQQASGSVVQMMAQGGLTPMQPLAQMVPPNTWRVVGDRTDVPELFAPLDGSARSWALLMEGVRRMPGVMPMADGGVTGSGAQAVPGISVGDVSALVNLGPTESELRAFVMAAIRDWAEQKFGRGGLR
ncbi:phage tail tape measure protein [Microbacterium sp.]|uniref:phage tail tape measure protein n=1 Tax=Microbacterium sp. TaxID=51671 RepID=UPI0037CAF44C